MEFKMESGTKDVDKAVYKDMLMLSTDRCCSLMQSLFAFSSPTVFG